MAMTKQMRPFSAKSAAASRLRQRKYELVRELGLPEDLLGGCLSISRRRCGKPSCHCAQVGGHPARSLTYQRRGRKRVEYVPGEWVAEIEAAILNTQRHLDAVHELMAINVELLALSRSQRRDRARSLSRGAPGGELPLRNQS